MDVEDQLTVLAAASTLSMTKSHVFFTFAANPYDASLNSVRGIPSSRTLESVYSSDPENQNINILESLLIIAPDFPDGSAGASLGAEGTGGVEDAQIRRRRDVRVRPRRMGAVRDSRDRLSRLFHYKESGSKNYDVNKNEIDNKKLNTAAVRSLDFGSLDIPDNVGNPGKFESDPSKLSQKHISKSGGKNIINVQLLPQHQPSNKSLFYIPEGHLKQSKHNKTIRPVIETNNDIDVSTGSKNHDITFQRLLPSKPLLQNHQGAISKLSVSQQGPVEIGRNIPHPTVTSGLSRRPPSSVTFQSQSGSGAPSPNAGASSPVLAQAQGQKVTGRDSRNGLLSTPYMLFMSAMSKLSPLLFESDDKRNSNTNHNQANRGDARLNLGLDGSSDSIPRTYRTVKKPKNASPFGQPDGSEGQNSVKTKGPMPVVRPSLTSETSAGPESHTRRNSVLERPKLVSQHVSSRNAFVPSRVTRAPAELLRERRATDTFVASASDLLSIYDNVLLLCLAVHKYVESNGAIPNPSQFMDAVVDLSLEGRSGRINVGQGHQVAYNFKVYDFDSGQGTMEAKLAYQVSGEDQWTVAENEGISWPGGHLPSPDECFKQVPGCNDSEL